MILRSIPATAISRVAQALTTLPGVVGWLRVGHILLVTGSVVIPIGFSTKFLVWKPVSDLRTVITGACVAAVVPALVEEAGPLSAACFPSDGLRVAQRASLTLDFRRYFSSWQP